jgi:hypothetical protein
MLFGKELDKLEKNGFIILSDYLALRERVDMTESVMQFRSEFHTEKNVRNRISYPSDATDSRVSNAYMVTTERQFLPSIRLSMFNQPQLTGIVEDFQMMLAQINGVDSDEVLPTRCMLNMQTYEDKSKPVPTHMDGEYFETRGDSCRIVRGLIPQYVAVCTLYNESNGGTTIHDIEKGTEGDIESTPGDMLIFDNTRFLHSVKELNGKRGMIGLRNFDYNPFYYNQEFGEKVFHECFSGLRERVTTARAKELHTDFIKQWKQKCDTQGVDAAKF